MGTISHNAIIVTGHLDMPGLKEAHAMAKEIFPHVSEIVPGVCNAYASFFIPPDGSKEGWAESDAFDGYRKTFRDWLKKQTDLYVDSVEVQFGECGDEIVEDE